MMHSTAIITACFLATGALSVTFNKLDSSGYYLPSSGTASTTQFYLGPELSSGTACGVDELPNGKSTSGKQGGGPGYLYVREASSLRRVFSGTNATRRLLLTSSPLAPTQAVRTSQYPAQSDQSQHAPALPNSDSPCPLRKLTLFSPPSQPELEAQAVRAVSATSSRRYPHPARPSRPRP